MATTLPQEPMHATNADEQGMRSTHTYLRAIISGILHRRQCLPRKSFKKRDHLLNSQAHTVVPMMMIDRGGGVRANSLLDWLDGPTLEALNSGELRALQICIHPDEYARHKVLETYTLGLWRVNDLEAGGLMTHVDRSECDSGIRDLLLFMNDYCAKMPDLPDTRFLSMNILLNSGSALLLNSTGSTGFEELAKDVLIFPQTGSLYKRSETFPPVVADLHCMTLRVTYMQREPPSTAEALHPIDNEPHMLVDEDLEHMINHPYERDENATSGQLKELVGNNGLSTDPALGATSLSRYHLLSQPEPDLTQQIVASLQAMQRPERRTQGDTQSSTQSGASKYTLHGPAYKTFQGLVRLKHSQKRFRFEIESPDAVREQAAHLAKEIGGTAPDGQSILCICGYAEEEGDMLKCECCMTLQHAHCCGFFGMADPRRPDQHICYLCAIDPSETDVSEELIQISLVRRALFHILRHGARGKGDFADKLNVPTKVAVTLMEQLKKDGNMVAAHGAHKAGHKSSGAPTWVPAQDEAYEKTLDQYFDPTTYVEAYFQPDFVQPSLLVDVLAFPDAQPLPDGVVPQAVRAARKQAKLLDQQSKPVKRTAAENYARGKKRKLSRHDQSPTPDLERKHRVLESTYILDSCVPAQPLTPQSTEP